MLRNCPECGRLWAAYLEARSEYLRIQGSMQAAVEASDHALLGQLAALSRRAWMYRLRWREALHAHGAFQHYRAGAATGGSSG